MRFRWFSFRQWVILMNPCAITGNYSWQKSICVFLATLLKFCTGVYLGCFEHFWYPCCTNFSVAKLSDDGHNCWFSGPYAAHSSLVVMRRPFWVNPVFGLCCHCCGRVCHQCSFSLLLTQWTQHLTELISMASSPYTLLRHLWISIGLQPFAVTITAVCLVCPQHPLFFTAFVWNAFDWLEHHQSWWSCTTSLSGKKGKRLYWHHI